MPFIFFKYFILIIIVDSKYFKLYFIIVCILPRNIGQKKELNKLIVFRSNPIVVRLYVLCMLTVWKKKCLN